MDFEELKREYHKQEILYDDNIRREKYFSGEKVDFLPYELNGIDISIVDNLGHTTTEMAQNLELKDEVTNIRINNLGIVDELIGINIGSMMGSEIISQEHGTSYVQKHILQDYNDFEKLPRINADTNIHVLSAIEKAKTLKERNPDIRIRLFTNGPWSAAAKIRPIEKLLRDIRKDKSNLINLLEFCNETNLKFIEKFTKEVGKVRVFMTDPVTCLDLLSIRQFEVLSFPYLKDLIDKIYQITGYKPGLHICGHTQGIWKFIGEMNISFFGVDNIEDLELLKESIGDKVVISGNVPPLDVFRNGTIDDVIISTKNCIIKGADNPKGFLIDAGCQLPLGVPKENLYAYVYAVRKYGQGASIGKLPEGLKNTD